MITSRVTHPLPPPPHQILPLCAMHAELYNIINVIIITVKISFYLIIIIIKLNKPLAIHAVNSEHCNMTSPMLFFLLGIALPSLQCDCNIVAGGGRVVRSGTTSAETNSAGSTWWIT